MIVPAIRVRDNVALGPNQDRVKLRGVEIATGEAFPGQLMAMNPSSVTQTLPGVATTEPAFGMPATWISEATRFEAELAGYAVVDPITVLVTHLTEVIRKNAGEILARQDTQVLLHAVK